MGRFHRVSATDKCNSQQLSAFGDCYGESGNPRLQQNCTESSEQTARASKAMSLAKKDYEQRIATNKKEIVLFSAYTRYKCKKLQFIQTLTATCSE